MLDIRGGGGEGMYAGTGTYWGREITSGDEAFGRPRVEDSGADAVCFGAICVDSDSMGERSSRDARACARAAARRRRLQSV